MIDQIREQLGQWPTTNNQQSEWYQASLALYKQHPSHNASLARLLSSAESKFFRNKLRNELEQLISLQPVANNQQPTANSQEPIANHIALRNKSVRRQDYLRGQLPFLRDVPAEKAYPICREILQLDDQINHCWKVIHHFQEHGTLPDWADSPLQGGESGVGSNKDLEQVFSTATTYFDIARIHSGYKTNVSKARNGKLPAEKLPFYQAVLDHATNILKTELPSQKPTANSQ